MGLIKRKLGQHCQGTTDVEWNDDRAIKFEILLGKVDKIDTLDLGCDAVSSSKYHFESVIWTVRLIRV